MAQIEFEVLSSFIDNINTRYPNKIKEIDLRCLIIEGMRELNKQQLPHTLPEITILNNALIFCATDYILRHSKDITWDILLELKKQKPYLGIKKR